MYRVINKPERAFTLIELLIAMSVFSLFMGVAYRLFLGGQKTAQISMWNQTIISQQRNAMTRLKKDLSSSSYPSVVFGDTMEDASEAGASKQPLDDHCCNYSKHVTAPAPGAVKGVVAFPCSKPYGGPSGGAGRTVFKVFCLVGEKTRNLGQQLASLYFFEFKSDYNSNAWSGITLGSAQLLSKGRILENVKEIDVDALQSLEVRIKCEMPDVPTTKRQNVGSIQPNVELKDNEGYLSSAASKCQGAL